MILKAFSAREPLSRYNERGIAEGLLASCDIFDPAAGAWIEDRLKLVAGSRHRERERETERERERE